MTSLYEILKASKTGIASDLLTALRGRQYAASLIQERELEGVPPLLFKANGSPLIDWSVYGNTTQNGTPTPDNPITPQGCGEKTGNLLNLNLFAEKYEGKVTFDNGVFDVSIASQDMYTTGISVDIPANTTFSCENVTKENQSLRGRIKFVFDDNTTQDVLITLSDGTTAQNPVVSFAKAIIAIKLDWSTFNGGFSFKLAMLNSGSTALLYEPYGYKLTILSGGNNLFDDFDIVGQVPSVNNGNLANYNDGACTDLIELSSGLLTLSIYETMVVYVFLYDANKSFLGWVNLSSAGTRTTKQITNYETAKYARVRTDNYSAYLNNKKIMLNEGGTALPYEPYNRTTTPVYLGEVQTTRKVKKLVLTGEENWTEYGSGSSRFFYTSISPTGYNDSKLVMSTHFQYTSGSSAAYSVSLASNGTMLRIYDRETNWADVTAFATWLAVQYSAGTPVTVWYVLATEETAVVNEPLQKIGDYADSLTATQAGVEIPTIKGNNTLDIDTTVKPSKVYIKYKG